LSTGCNWRCISYHSGWSTRRTRVCQKTYTH